MITIYTKTTCPYCSKAKALLTELDIAFEEINIEDNPHDRAFLKEQGHKMVPQLYSNGRLLVAGGYDGLSCLTKGEILERIEETSLSL